MEKTIIVNEQEVKLKSNGATPLLYKKHFGKDFFSELMKMQGNGKKNNLENLDLEIFYNFTWLFAKQADNSIPPQLEWFDSFDSFPIMDVIGEIQDMITSTIQTNKKK